MVGDKLHVRFNTIKNVYKETKQNLSKKLGHLFVYKNFKIFWFISQIIMIDNII